MADGLPCARSTRWTGLGLAIGLALTLGALTFYHSLHAFLAEAGGAKVLNSVVDGPIVGTALGYHLTGFALAQLLVHVLFGFLLYALAFGTQLAWPTVEPSRRKLVVGWFAVCTWWVICANARFFPHTAVGQQFRDIVHHEVLGFSVFTGFTVVLGALLALLTIRVLQRSRGQRRRNVQRFAVAASVVVATSAAVAHSPWKHAAAATNPSQPHVIIIGIDSFRSDRSATDGSAALTPNLERFMNEATTFSDAMTPLARTYPSWVSLLTGRHPHTTGAVINLIPTSRLTLGKTLPDLLRDAGYQAIYSIDEVRFSNIDTSYGFDKQITPPMGGADFALGPLNDLPLSNLLVNTWIGRVLFPFTHANRAAVLTYDPDAFVRRINREVDFGQPTFFTTHLTLPHWPYIWADAPPVPENAATRLRQQHAAALTRVDRQFGDILQVLAKKGALQNAIVIVLSDHGESLDERRDSILPTSALEDAKIARAGLGHGTSVFVPCQYRTLLAIRSFGNTPLTHLQPENITSPVSLEDIAPTLQEALSLKGAERFDGVSLLPLLTKQPGAAERLAQRFRFTETEFNPAPLTTGALAPSASAIRAAAVHYQVDPKTGRLTMRPERLARVIAMREYAIIHGNRLLAAIPSSDRRGFRYVLADMRGGIPSFPQSPPACVDNSEVTEMWARLHQRFPALTHSGSSDYPSCATSSQ